MDKYPYAGHSTILKKTIRTWQDTDYVLRLFSLKKKVAQKKYRDFVEKGISQGRRPELIGGGLIRSVGGWGCKGFKEWHGQAQG